MNNILRIVLYVPALFCYVSMTGMAPAQGVQDVQFSFGLDYAAAAIPGTVSEREIVSQAAAKVRHDPKTPPYQQVDLYLLDVCTKYDEMDGVPQLPVLQELAMLGDRSYQAESASSVPMVVQPALTQAVPSDPIQQVPTFFWERPQPTAHVVQAYTEAVLPSMPVLFRNDAHGHSVASLVPSSSLSTMQSLGLVNADETVVVEAPAATLAAASALLSGNIVPIVQAKYAKSHRRGRLQCRVSPGCPESFSYPEALNKHERTCYWNGTNFECPECHKAFWLWEKAFKRHVMDVHNMRLPLRAALQTTAIMDLAIACNMVQKRLAPLPDSADDQARKRQRTVQYGVAPAAASSSSLAAESAQQPVIAIMDDLPDEECRQDGATAKSAL